MFEHFSGRLYHRHPIFVDLYWSFYVDLIFFLFLRDLRPFIADGRRRHNIYILYMYCFNKCEFFKKILMSNIFLTKQTYHNQKITVS